MHMPQASTAPPKAMSTESSKDGREMPRINSSSSDDAPPSANNNDLEKPTRPLTAYHLFFQLEREYILQTTPTTENLASDSVLKVDDRPIGREIDPSMPHRYRYIRLSPLWYASRSGKRRGREVKKRKHRKTHGKIGFLDLSKRIAARWAGLEENERATKEYVTSIYGRELEVYRRAVKEYKEKNVSALVAQSLNLMIESTDVDMDETKFGSKRTSIRSLDELPTESAGEATKITPPENIIGRATTASSSECIMPSSPWSKQESNSTSYDSIESVPSASYGAEAGVNFEVSISHGEAHQPELRHAFMKDEEMQVDKKKEMNSFDECSFHPVPPSFWKRYKNCASSKRGGRRHSSSSSSKMSSLRRHYSSGPKISSCSFEIPRFSSQAPYGYSRREAMLPIQPMEFLQPTMEHGHSCTSSSALFQLGKEFEGEDIRAGGSYDDPGGIVRGRGTANTCRYQNELGTFLSRNYHQQEYRRGRGHDLGIGTTLINHRPTSAFEDRNDASAIKFPPLGSEDAAGITADDAIGLMNALSDDI